MTTVGFEPTPLRTGALSQRLRPLGQTVLKNRFCCFALKISTCCPGPGETNPKQLRIWFLAVSNMSDRTAMRLWEVSKKKNLSTGPRMRDTAQKMHWARVRETRGPKFGLLEFSRRQKFSAWNVCKESQEGHPISFRPVFDFTEWHKNQNRPTISCQPPARSWYCFPESRSCSVSVNVMIFYFLHQPIGLANELKWRFHCRCFVSLKSRMQAAMPWAKWMLPGLPWNGALIGNTEICFWKR